MLHFTEQDISNLHDLDMEMVLENYGLEPYPNGKHLCPFHEDHSPSLYLNKKKNRCECYVCNKKWDTIAFVQDFEKVEFPQALIRLVEISGGDSSKYNKKPPKIKWRRLTKEEKALLNFNQDNFNQDYPNKPIKNWSIERTEKGECFPNYNSDKEKSFYDGYLVLIKGKLNESYLYTEFPDIYRMMVCEYLAKAIESTKKKYEEGQDVSKEIVILNKLKKDFKYDKNETPLYQ